MIYENRARRLNWKHKLGCNNIHVYKKKKIRVINKRPSQEDHMHGKNTKHLRLISKDENSLYKYC